MMKLIVGLGNPGAEYAGSRHNIGFDVAAALASENHISLKKDKYTSSICGSGDIGGHPVLIAMPQTYMNLSGSAVSALCRRYRVKHSDILVICDDLDLEFGRLKIRPGGSSAGHRGLKSVIDAVGSSEVARVRVGISRPGNSDDPAEYVLSPFGSLERKNLGALIDRARQCCRVWICEGVTESMNIFNKKELNP